jgi:hydrogenase-4 component F
MILIALVAVPLLAAGLIAIARRRPVIELVHVLAAAGTLAMAVIVIVPVWRDNAPASVTIALAGVGLSLRVDALSGLMVLIVTIIGAIAALYSLGYIRSEISSENLPRARRFFVLFNGFIFTMLLAVTSDNLGVMWVAIEGTTLATVFLVNLHDTQTSLEAAYKYLIISSIGIALAFVGTVLMYYAGAARAGEIAVNWTALRDAAGSLNPQVVRLAFVFVLIGYGTKAGLAPMHTWLPDAHSEAPAPISALMSGVLLNVGLYALLRFKTIADIAVGPVFAARSLLGLGLLSIGAAAAFLLVQRNYKRMLAYSSVEHMGIICLGLGFGGYWGTLGALLHVINHALSKSLLFMLSGNILLKYRTTDLRRVRGLLRASPVVGAAFLSGAIALIGLPPFGPFISEFMIFRAGFAGGPRWVAMAALGLLVAAFAGMLSSVNHMLYGEAPEKIGRGDTIKWSLAPLAVNLCLLLVLGLTLPRALLHALEQALRILGG